MSTKGVVKKDKFLTNLATAFPVGNKIGLLMAPRVGAELASDFIFVDSDDAIVQQNDNAEAAPTSEVDFSVGTPYAYKTRRRGLNTTILDKEARNTDMVVKLETKNTNKLTNRLQLKHEVRTAAIFTDPTKISQGETLTGTAKWDASSPDLEATIIRALNAIYDETGRVANTIQIPYSAALYAANMSFIKDTLKFDFGMNIVTAQFQGQMMKTVGLPPVIKGLNVIISNGRKDTSKKGQTKVVTNPWGKDCLIGYIPPTVPFVDDDFGVITMEYEGLAVRKKRLDDPLGTKIWVDWDYDIVEGNLATWYLIQNVIA